MAITNISNVSITSGVTEGGYATLRGTITDPVVGNTFSIAVAWGDGSQRTIQLGAETLNAVSVGGDLVTWDPAAKTYAIQHRYADDAQPGTASDQYTVTGTVTDSSGGTGSLNGGVGSGAVTTGGNIFMTGHDILLHNHQNGFDTVVLDYLRGAGTGAAISRADYDIGYLRTTDRGVPGGTGTGFNTSQFGQVHEATITSFATAADFSAYLAKVDVLYIPWLSDIGGVAAAQKLATFAPQIAAFINAGGDIALESSQGNDVYYSFLPPGIAASGPAISGSTGFAPTAAGAAIGLTTAMTNNNATHNSFTSFDDDFTVLEVRGTEAISIGVRNATVGAGGITTGLTVTVANAAPVAAAVAATGAVEDGGPRTFAFSATDAGGDAMTYAVLTQPAEGSVTNNGDGTFSFNPGSAFQNLAAGATRQVSFTYRATDEDGGVSNTATVTVTVTGANDAPVVTGVVQGAVSEDAVSSLNALARASDVDAGAVLAVVDVPVSLPAGVAYADGVFTLNAADPAYQALAQGQTTTVSVSYGVSDGTAVTPAVASWTVTGANDAPVVSGVVTAAAAEDAVASLNALAQASDVDAGAVLTVVGVPASLPAGVSYADGVFTLNAADPAYQALAQGQTTTVTVSYGVSDGSAVTPATATFTVTGANDAPVVSGVVTGAAAEDGAAVSLNALTQASDIDAGAVLSVVDLPAALPPGVSFADGVFTLDASDAAYQALGAGETVAVSVAYGVSDGLATTPAVATWTVTGANDAPVVTGVVQGAVSEDAVSSLNALAQASDVDAGAVLAVVGVPASLPAGVAYADGVFTLNAADPAYQALAQGQTTTVSVSYGVSDGTAVTPAMASWTVTGANDTPVVSGVVTAAAAEDSVASLNALAQASDVDAGAVLTVVGVPASLPAGVSYADGVFTLNAADPAYQALAQGQTTTVTVSYGVSDGSAVTPAAATFTVTGANDAPVVSGVVTGAAAEDGAAVSLNALDQASDVDAGAVLTVVGLPATLPPGVTYDADAKVFRLDTGVSAYQSLAAGQTQVVTIAYGVSDGVLTTSAQASWTVVGANDGPVARADNASVAEDGAVTLAVRSNDTDVDAGDVLTISAVGPTALGGSVSIVDGKIVYAADGDALDLLTLGQSVVDTFTYTVKDSANVTSTATVSVTVTGVADGADIVGGNRSQNLQGTALDEKISGGNAEDSLSGGEGADKLYGGNGKDLLLGGQGRDQLFGENGADTLDGGAGDDLLSGGAGPDVFVFGAAFGKDVVVDFAAEDSLRFSKVVFATATQAFQAAVQDGSDVVVLAGLDSVRLVGVSLSSLTAGDFIVG